MVICAYVLTTRAGLLSDGELNHFQFVCFGVELSPTELAGVKEVVKESMTGGIRDNGLTLDGFLYLHKLFVQRGRLETTLVKITMPCV